ncbi:hypothetical protein [Aliikangiella coralliicola]|uniref:Uncharacterized protein n=1 Tax=Aliikangiella coralliicola TaxID=2592383 RepID=A0A545UIF1_9GAMM|nr:hypothetical protein [Aliikangiella coralliicola]TQV89242.1 hypothetical protein FLL46_03690 [Aliikangiella coralliicola]
MHIVINKIPKAAIVCYCVGFAILIAALIVYFYFSNLIEPVRLQQIFIGGAIVVVVGSVINTLYQFRPGRNSQDVESQSTSRQDQNNLFPDSSSQTDEKEKANAE